ncbi:MAG: CAP domain-containing protein [Deltaproteobacteria bacterium]|nr:CAP domain-containing protein [Deltaproteobacteria bacterium]
MSQRSSPGPWPLVVALLVLGGGALLWRQATRGPAPTPAPPGPDAPPTPPPSEPDPPEVGPTAEAPEPPPTPGPKPPPVRAGERVTIQLSEPPATWYGKAEQGGNEAHYRALLRQVAGPNAVFSAELGRAAREMVFQYTELGREPPSDVRDFLIRGAGAIAADTTFQHATSNSDAGAVLERTLRAAVREPLDGDGPLVVGVGEVFVPGTPPTRHIGVVATRLAIALEPTPRTVAPGATLMLRGRLLAAFTGLDALAMGPDGELRKGTVRRNGRDGVQVLVAAGSRAGPLDVQLVGVGPRGPGKLVQLRVEVSDVPAESALSDQQTFVLPPDESGLADAKDAAALAWKLLNDDREAYGLARLAWDPQLAEVAEGHSRDMRDAGFFSHRSPTTGLHADRLARAGYRTTTSAENLALNVSLAEAERGLMHSLGHRRNLLGRDFTHGGVGVVGEEREGGGRRWWVTQLFARPVRRLDPSAEVRLLRDRIDSARRERALPALVGEAGLDGLAERYAGVVATSGVDGVGDQVLEAARNGGLLGRKLRAWVVQAPEPESVDVPAAALVPAARRLGVALAQAPERGQIGVVLLIGE